MEEESVCTVSTLPIPADEVDEEDGTADQKEDGCCRTQ